MMTAVNKTLFTNGRIVITEFVSCAYHAQLFVTQITYYVIYHLPITQTNQAA